MMGTQEITGAEEQTLHRETITKTHTTSVHQTPAQYETALIDDKDLRDPASAARGVVIAVAIGSIVFTLILVLML